MSTIHRITADNPPQFPCWVWHTWPRPYWLHMNHNWYPGPICHYSSSTHWHPDQSTPPATAPDQSTTGVKKVLSDFQQPTACDTDATHSAKDVAERERAIARECAGKFEQEWYDYYVSQISDTPPNLIATILTAAHRIASLRYGPVVEKAREALVRADSDIKWWIESRQNKSLKEIRNDLTAALSAIDQLNQENNK